MFFAVQTSWFHIYHLPQVCTIQEEENEFEVTKHWLNHFLPPNFRSVTVNLFHPVFKKERGRGARIKPPSGRINWENAGDNQENMNEIALCTLHKMEFP